MEFFANPVIAVVLLLGVLIFVHEAGHFLVGKACGIAVETFSIGFGPSILKFSRGETRYQISAIPLGGFVKFYGSTRKETVPDEIRGREFYKAPIWKRFLTILAGPAFNFILAIFVYTAMFGIGVPDFPPIVGEIIPNSPAEQAGLQFGDVVTQIGEDKISTWKDLQKGIMKAPKEKISLTVKRGDQLVNMVIVPESIYDAEMIGTKYRGQIGISPGHVPSLVTITDRAKPAYQSGLRTGDKITSIQSDNRSTAEVKYWREIAPKLIKFKESGAKNVTLQVDRAEKIHPELPEHRTVALDLQNLPDQQKAFDQAMGWEDSQLTLSEVDPKNAKVLRVGDRILSWNGKAVTSVFDLRDILISNTNPKATVEVRRETETQTIDLDLEPTDVQKAQGRVVQYIFKGEFLGALVQPDVVIERYTNPLVAFWHAGRQVAEQTGMIGLAVAGLFTGDMPLQSLGGPISIAKVASDSVKMGWLSFFSALSLISINLGLLNLFPIPVLDGGQIVMLSVEAVRRRPLSEHAIENFQKIGFVLILALVVMATYNDLSRFWVSMLKGLSGAMN
ncbi:MAG: RIP metalloprotease RseP [Oligoflexales bacterium]